MNLSVVHRTFLDIIKRSINNEIDQTVYLSKQQFKELFILAEEQNLLPMVVDYLFKSRSINSVETDVKEEFQNKAFESVARQITKKNEFLNLLEDCQKQGYDPIVVKGIICQNLYPVGMLRPSVDEDILVLPNEIDFYNDFFQSKELVLDKQDTYTHNVFELSYHRRNSPTYLELHTRLFDPQAEGYNHLNHYFGDELFDRSVKIQIDDIYVRTLSHTDHFLFLIFHLYKHFIYSGVGVRPVCDIGLYADKYGEFIEWGYIKTCLEKSNILYFVSAILNIIKLYLLPESNMFSFVSDWDVDSVEIGDLLKDMLESGALGNSSIDRLHTSNMTLHAIEGHKHNFVLASLFPPIRKMKGRYRYLERYPVLIPIAWVDRIVNYLFKKNKDNHKKTESIKLGRERIKLLRKYKLMK